MAGANFHDAMTICQYSYRSTLVTIHSEQEFNFLSEMVFDRHHAKYSVWIGLIRASNDSFVWFDRSPLNYTNWGPNEPNNWNSKNYCAVMSSAPSAKGKWFDVGCTTTYLVICQNYLSPDDNHLINDTDSDDDLSIADQINMKLEDSDSDRSDKSSLINQLNALKILGNVNIVLTTILFIIIILIFIKYKYNFVFIRRRNHRNSDMSSFGRSTDI